jgi:hypothetical protein
MNEVIPEIVEIWSLPWHQLQRRLAERAAGDRPAAATAFRDPETSPRSPREPRSWLARALADLPRWT